MFERERTREYPMNSNIQMGFVLSMNRADFILIYYMLESITQYGGNADSE